MNEHVAHVKARFGLPVYVNSRGDVLADCNGKAIVASAREIAMNSGERMPCLWSARYAYLRHNTADYLKHGDWVAA